MTDPFCVNEADPQNDIGNHCVCQNGATLDIIPFETGRNMSDYQPCAYTTVDGDVDNNNNNTSSADYTRSIVILTGIGPESFPTPAPALDMSTTETFLRTKTPSPIYREQTTVVLVPGTGTSFLAVTLTLPFNG